MWLRRRQIWSLGSPAREETSRSGPCALKPAPFAGPLTASTARSEAPPLSPTAPPVALMFPHRAILQLAAHTRRVPMARRAILIHPRPHRGRIRLQRRATPQQAAHMEQPAAIRCRLPAGHIPVQAQRPAAIPARQRRRGPTLREAQAPTRAHIPPELTRPAHQ